MRLNVRNRTTANSVEIGQACLVKLQAPQRPTEPNYLSALGSNRLAPKVASLSVLVANGAHALVVLVVEDEFLVRYNIADCLQEAGYVVVEAGSGEEALALCNSETSIDIVITDINLGGFASGWDVAECFRRFRPDILVVYVSGKLLDTERRVPRSVFITKPYQNGEILEACQRLAAEL